MADEAFALSPISARAAQPSEADYDAIQEAFMETSRGRWFLGEYAKRNRNADTRMVLDAVARIEVTLAASRKPEPDPSLDKALLEETLASFRAALMEARKAATAAIGDLALEQNLAPVRKGARVIREIAWRLREIGADGRICDLIDSQVSAIEVAAGKLNSADLAAALHEAFDRVEQKIAGFDAEDAPAASASPPEAAPASDAASEPAQAHTKVHAEKPAETTATVQAAPQASPQTSPQTSLGAHHVEVAATDPVASDETPMISEETEAEPADAFDASDEAMLDMVAMEMAAPDTDTAYEPEFEEGQSHEQTDEPQADKPQANDIHVSVASYEIDVTFPEASDKTNFKPDVKADAPVSASALPLVTPLQPAAGVEVEAAFTASLGSSLLANGIVPRPRTARPDPLAPIRRMSQTEKIAFFS
jgi:hypothetical protein